MVMENEFPIFELDDCREPIIHPTNYMKKCLPEKCVITFFRHELNEFVEPLDLPVLAHLHSEIIDIPVYEYTCGDEKICICMPFSMAPGAAETIEELRAMGAGKFIICGAAGSLECGSKVGEVVVPVAAVRDEGTSYHYLPPSREIECNMETTKVVMKKLEEMGIPFRTGKTWTTDCMYRETPEKIEQRRDEGCITVEMEASSFFTLSKYYRLPLAQILYVGDDVSGTEWNSRDWNKQKQIRRDMLMCAIEVVKEL